MSEVVLDASALMAVLEREPGAEVVVPVLRIALMTTVNLGEVLTKLVERGVPESDAYMAIARLGLRLIEVDVALARASARLRAQTKRAGLSLGDRVCLALGEHRGLPVLTADCAWAGLRLPVEVRVIR